MDEELALTMEQALAVTQQTTSQLTEGVFDGEAEAVGNLMMKAARAFKMSGLESFKTAAKLTYTDDEGEHTRRIGVILLDMGD